MDIGFYLSSCSATQSAILRDGHSDLLYLESRIAIRTGVLLPPLFTRSILFIRLIVRIIAAGTL